MQDILVPGLVIASPSPSPPSIPSPPVEIGWSDAEWLTAKEMMGRCGLATALSKSQRRSVGVQRALHEMDRISREGGSVNDDQLRLEIGARVVRIIETISQRYFSPVHTTASRGTWYYEYKVWVS